MAFHADFEINIIAALADQLLAEFGKLEVSSLSEENITELPKGQGIYQLYQSGKLVYVGKAHNLRKRLDQHRIKIAGRRGISIEDMGFNCLSVHRNWNALAPEGTLQRYYRKLDRSLCSWHGISFGPHDPGRRRETTNKPPDGFDSRYVIEEAWPCRGIKAGEYNGRTLLMALKKELPFVFRYETANPKAWRRGHPGYNDATITVPEDNMPARDLLREIARQLPGWQATIFPSHMILYKETASYWHGRVVWPAP